MRVIQIVSLLLLALPSVFAQPSHAAESLKQRIHLNQVQSLGTHNSFHPGPVGEPLAGIIRKRYPWFIGQGEYRQASLTHQLEQFGMRHFELDVFADPKGGRFAKIPLLASIGQDPDRHIPALSVPGFKVFHLPQIDSESTCWTLVTCLRELKTWSDAHPRHFPITVIIEIKDVDFLGLATYIPIKPFTDADYAALDAEVVNTLGREHLITPDDVRGNYPSLEQAVLKHGWPSLAKSRGKFLVAQYHGRPHSSRYGHVMFADAKPGNPDAGFVILEDVRKNFSTIQQLVKSGYLVRTRSDINLVEAFNNDYSRYRQALASGAQYISTDVPEPNPITHTDFHVRFSGNQIARCNVLNAPPACKDQLFSQ